LIRKTKFGAVAKFQNRLHKARNVTIPRFRSSSIYEVLKSLVYTVVLIVTYSSGYCITLKRNNSKMWDCAGLESRIIF